MPWTEESDPTSPSNASKGASKGRGSEGDAPADASHAVGQSRPAGPWGAPPPKRPKSPVKTRAASPPPARPDLDRLTLGLRARVFNLLHRPVGYRVGKRMLIGALVGFAAGWALSGVYEVRPDERAVVTRLGVVETVTGPGLHAHLPWPLEQAETLAVTRINALTLGGAAEDGSQALNPTADAQLADLIYTVQWRIADPVAYLFHVADPQGALKLAAETAMRQVVGATPLAAVASADRKPLERSVAAAIQQRLNHLSAGIAVTGVLIQGVSLPPDVQAAAADVAIARQDAQAAVADAEAYRARTVGEAKAAAAKTLIEAQSYRDQTLQEAQGAAARFEQLDAAYRKAPGVTKDRLYFETLQGVLSRAHTIVIDPAKGGSIALPPDLLHAAVPSRAPTAPANGPAPPPGAKP